MHPAYATPPWLILSEVKPVRAESPGCEKRSRGTGSPRYIEYVRRRSQTCRRKGYDYVFLLLLICFKITQVHDLTKVHYKACMR